MSILHYDVCPLCKSSAIAEERKVKDHSITKEVFALWRCAACDFLFTQDPPVAEEAGRYYKGEEYISHSDNQEGLVNKLYHKARDFMLAQKYRLVNRVANGKRLLDYGTGTGYFTDFMVRKGYSAEGIEIDTEARKYGADKFGITIRPPGALFNVLPADSLDVITLWHVLEHLYEPQTYLARFRELLSDQGKLIVAVPNHKSKDAKAYGAYWAAYDVPRHLWHFSPATMRRMMESSGFRVVETHHMPLDPFYVSIMSQKYKTGGGLVSGGLKGLGSFFSSSADAERGSSVIYVIEKGDLSPA
ncbi:class I SAM-dependent methyltransferase [Neolewinella aurantiaca]|uniref:Class I SAM-dependent methyltransferase n=1 Tax=Neolewinella aurantiaca TaxID=2602767 RepID=A0A5C7FH61_9BACT|nr:class I SAM-dependent methyltransferase [Neolewinella aurantiaca]TXF90398.1 class I SAM-dependent methyltransferase [Neolewinella aurantiaca]